MMRAMVASSTAWVAQGGGEIAPMPPVFGPVSLSPTRLWSAATPRYTASSPSQRAKTEISSPERNSSITTSAPAAPRILSSMMAVMAACGLVQRLGDHHALAGGQAVGLDDDRRAHFLDIIMRGVGIGEGFPGGGRDIRGVGDFLGEALAPSNCAAAAVGPQQAMPAAAQASARPATSGASGPGITRSILFATAKATSPAMSVVRIDTLVAKPAVPGLPGATNSSVRRGLEAIAHASACSRPPEPTINTRITLTPLLPPRALS